MAVDVLVRSLNYPSSSFEYGMVEWCRTSESVAYPSSVTFRICDPQSVIISKGVLKQHECRHNASVASSTVTFFVEKSSHGKGINDD